MDTCMLAILEAKNCDKNKSRMFYYDCVHVFVWFHMMVKVWGWFHVHINLAVDSNWEFDANIFEYRSSE